MRFNRSHEFSIFVRGLKRHAHMDRNDTVRGVYTVNRRFDSTVDAMQLPIRSSRVLRIMKAGNGATNDDIGKFWFTPGYSRVGTGGSPTYDVVFVE